MMAAAMTSPAWGDQGVVREIVDSSRGYLYLLVEKATPDGKQTQNEWVTVDAMTVRLGDTLSYDEGMFMANFFSDALQRNFPNMRFVTKASVVAPKPSNSPQ